MVECLNILLDNVNIDMKWMGGGFGCWVYFYYLVEVVVILKKVNKLVKFIYICEDDMIMGIYWLIYLVKLWVVLNE